MKSILEVAKSFLQDCVPPDGILCDFTMGNGSDTLYLAGLVPQGRVYAFDIQPLALEHTRQRLEQAGAGQNVELILDSHARVDRYVQGPIDAGMFNLGYLPTSDRVVTTKVESTLEAIEKAVALLKVGGVLVVVVYPGHDEGKREGEEIYRYACTLSAKKFDVTCYRLINIPDCPYIYAFEKRKA